MNLMPEAVAESSSGLRRGWRALAGREQVVLLSYVKTNQA